MRCTFGRSNRHDLASLAVMVVAALIGCGESPTHPGSRGGESTISISADVSATTAGLTVEITAADIDPPMVQNIPIVGTVASGTVTIPAGARRTLTVRAFDGGAVETHRGSVELDVEEGVNLEVTFDLEPLVGDVPIVVNTATYVVTLDAATIALAAAGTHQLSATVTDAAGIVSGAVVTWGARNPVIASVDQTGLVTGGVAGSTSVVAQYRRAVAVVAVTVGPGGPGPSGSGMIVFSRQIAFGRPDIYVMNADGTGVSQLTSGPTMDIAPSWSPDGRRIAFSRVVIGATAADQTSSIVVMNADGTGQTVLTSGTFGQHPSWSPDGTRIVYWTAPVGSADLWTINADGTGAAELLMVSNSLTDPDWSPDGTRIAFARHIFGHPNANNRDVDVANSDGTGRVTVATSDSTDSGPAWSPDGTKIAFHSNRHGNFEIYVINPDGTGLTRLTNDAASDTFPAWSPDGTRIVFSRPSTNSTTSLYVMNADGSGVAQLTSGALTDSYPDWVALPPAAGAGAASR